MPGPGYTEFLHGIDFRFVQPGDGRGADGRFAALRGEEAVTLLELPGSPFDFENAELPQPELRETLRPLCTIPRMGTLGVGAVLNRAVAGLAPGEAFVNVGVWNGFSFLCGLRGNPEKLCIGVDNFSQYRGPRDAFMARLEENRGRNTHFFDMDYRDYFARHEGPLGVYFFDGPHNYEQQFLALQVAEPFFAPGCVIVVDDTNWGNPHQATMDFIEQSERDYEVLLDARTNGTYHPTFWNGLIVFRAGEATGRGRTIAGDTRVPEPSPIDFDGRSTRVSVVTAHTVEPQSWPNVEVASAFEETTGSFVAFASGPVDREAVEAGLALPELCRFDRGELPPSQPGRIRQALAATREIRETVPRDAAFVLAARGPDIAQPLATDRMTSLFGSATPGSVSGEQAIERVESLTAEGVRYAAFTSGVFGWLEQRPALVDHLRRTSEPVRETDSVRIVRLA